MKHYCISRLLLAAVAFAALPAVSHGTIITNTHSGSLPVTLTGSLPNQGTALAQAFTLAAPSDLIISTDSYAAGGFQTNLLLFDGMGMFVTAGVPAGMPDPNTGLIGDSRLRGRNLTAGMYTLVIADFLLNQSLTATNLSDGLTVNYGNGTAFIDAFGNARTGNYSLSISTAVPDDPAAIPEPSTAWLAAPALAWLAFRARSVRS